MVLLASGEARETFMKGATIKNFGVAKATPSFQKDLPLLISMCTKITLSK